MITLALFLVLPAGRILTVGEVALQIEASTHVRIVVAAQLRADLLYVDARSATGEQLLAGVAQALHASLVRDGQTFELRRTSADKKAGDVALVTQRAGWLHDELDVRAKYRRAHFAKSGPDACLAEIHRLAGLKMDEVAKRQSSGPNSSVSALPAIGLFGVGLPSQLLLERVISRIGVEHLADIPTGEVRIYEEHPTTDAVSLPPVDDLRTEYEAAMPAFREWQLSDRDRSALTITNLGNKILGWSGSYLINRLRLKEEARPNAIYLTLEGFDSLGQRTAYGDLYAAPASSLGWSGVPLQRQQRNPDTRWIPYAAEKALRDSPNVVAGPQFADWQLHPDKIEPLDATIGSIYAAIASECPDNPCILAVSDCDIQYLSECVQNGRLNVDAFEAIRQTRLPYEAATIGNCFTWALNDP